MGTTNYLVGGNPKQWRTAVPSFTRVVYEQVYPGIDLAYHGSHGALEWDFLLAPWTDPETISLLFGGARRVSLASGGDLVLATGVGDVVLQRPRAFQIYAGVERETSVSYVLRLPNEVGFHVPNRDPSRPLVIDPILSYSTYMGGSGGFEAGEDIAVDPAGNAYVVGFTSSTDFPVRNPFQQSNMGGADAFVLKLDSSGKLNYSTYLGGFGDDLATGVAVDSSGAVYITGYTTSPDFPTMHSFQKTNASGVDGFVAKLDSSGSTLVYSSYLGGSRLDFPSAIAVDDAGAAYVTGFTDSEDFPLQHPFQPDTASPSGAEVFVTKVSGTGSSLVFSTFLGGSGEEAGNSIAVDASGATYVTGITGSEDFPLEHPIQATKSAQADAFVTKLDRGGSALVYSTYLGGAGADSGTGVAVGGDASAHIAGFTFSSDFPIANPLQSSLASSGVSDAFVAKIAPSGLAILYSTYLGGREEDAANGIAVDPEGSAYVAGYTDSPDFPTAHPMQAVKAGGRDAFVMHIERSGSALIYSTYLGGRGNETDVSAVEVDADGTAYMTGATLSSDFPTANAAQPTSAGGREVFVAKILGDLVDNDTDRDGLATMDEERFGTDPLDPDTDEDELLDGEEVRVYGTAPLDPDTDEDELLDGEEVRVYGTDPLDPDTDGDFFRDDREVEGGSDPSNPCSVPTPIGPLTLYSGCPPLPS